MVINKAEKGMTLIELMIVIVVLAIIVSLAYPSFLDQVRKARRADAKQALFDIASKLEQHYQDNKGYSGYALSTTQATSPEGYYAISITGLTATTFTLEADPSGHPDQKKDKCKQFTLDQRGEKASTGLPNNDCW